MPEGNTTQTSDAVLDAEQTEKVTVFLTLAIKDFLEDNYENSDDLRTHGIEMDLQDHGRDYAMEMIYEFAQPQPNENVRRAVAANPALDLSWLKLPEEATDENDDFRDLLEELYFKALERVSWHVGIVVTIE